MGILYEYFAAPSDVEAASVIARVGGPGSRQVAVERPGPERRGIFGRKPGKTVVEYADDTTLTV